MKRAKKSAVIYIVSVAGEIAALAWAIGATVIISLLICIGFHPEAAMNAEWAAAAMGLVWAGAMVARAGLVASVGSGSLMGLSWMLAWFYPMGRFNTHLWSSEALPAIAWYHVLAWLAAPALGLLGGLMRLRMRWFRGLAMHSLPLAVVFAVILANLLFAEKPGKYEVDRGIDLQIKRPVKDGTTVRLFIIDFTANLKLSAGIYDQDMHDSTPFNDNNSSYLGTPAHSVFDRLGDSTLLMINAGFFTWDDHRIASHVAPVVVGGRAYYDISRGQDGWTFGWLDRRGAPEFRLLHGVPFEELTKKFDYAFGWARPLIVNGKPLKLGPGPGVMRLKCSRVSIAWSKPGRLQILVVRDPDGEFASIRKMKAMQRQVGGWDLPQIQRFWMRKCMRNALILDSGDSTELVYQGTHRLTVVGSARFSRTLGYLNDRPIRVWIPILPVRHSNVGICNYIYIRRKA